MTVAVSEDILSRVREAFLSRRIAAGITWLEEHRDLVAKVGPKHPRAAQIIGYLSQWVDAGLSDISAIQGLLDQFPAQGRSQLPIDEYVHLLLAEGMVGATLQHGDDSILRFELIIAVAQQAPIDQRLLLLAHFQKARSLAAGGHFEEALASIAKSKELALSLGYSRFCAVIKILESSIHVEQDKLPLAHDLLEQARDGLGETDDWASFGDISFAHGLIAGNEGRYYQAMDRYTEAICCYRKRGVPKRSLVKALERMAIAKRQLTSRLARSIDSKLVRSRSETRRDDAKSQTHALSVRRCEQFRSEAFVELAEAETICQSATDVGGLGMVHMARGFLFLDKGELDKAVAEAKEANELGLAKKDPVLLARARILHSKVESMKFEDGIDEGYDPALHAQRAHDYAQDALGFAKRANRRELMAAAHIRVGITMCNDFFNDPEGASEYCDGAAAFLNRSRRDYLWEEFQRLRSYILRGKKVETVAPSWPESVIGDKTLRQLKDEFDQMIILQVWEREEHKISRVAKSLAISPKKVRRFVERFHKPVA